MLDKDKVISGLWLLAHWPDGLIITDKEKWIKSCCERAIELLKEQEERIKKFELEKSWDENPDTMGKW